MSRLIVGLVLFSATILSSKAAQLEGEGKMHASQRSKPGVDIVHAKLFFRVPFFDEDATYTEARRNFDEKVALKFRDTSLGYMKRLLVDGENLDATEYKNIMQALSFWQLEYVKFKSTDESSVQESFIQMLRDMLNSLSKTPDRYAIDSAKAYSRFEIAVNAIYELIKASPKGAYLHWTEGQVNGVRLTDYLKPVVATLYTNRQSYFVDMLSIMFGRLLRGEGED